MTTDVITVGNDATIDEAVALMLEHHVSALPVVGADGKLVGLISEGDLMRRLRGKDAPRRSWWLELFSAPEDSTDDFVKTRSRHVSDVMTRDVVSVAETTPVSEVARTLEAKRIKRVPVVRDGKVVGIVSRGNLLHALAQIDAKALPRLTATDEELRKAVLAALREVPGSAVNLINVTVDDGRVTIRGVADSDFVENGVRVAAENVPGVQGVDVHLGRLPSWGYGI
ncbi:CBS domain-containing protein [Pseudaestuariivita atlantica]|nr:CBS domain-containing protein [Pseudaestuariivita atlantica]